uniref:Uncharacterized protein n=1 Tax=Populus alba TaxID=43335 RepID=A0A4U5MQB1_POPAL|nr:hypothetical protein D5086_0000301370 [Populus alba]
MHGKGKSNAGEEQRNGNGLEGRWKRWRPTPERSKGGENPASTKNIGEEATLVNQPIPHHHLSSSSLKVLFANLQLKRAATASFAGLYLLYKDFKVAHDAISQQVESVHESLDRRISALEKLKQNEASQPLQAAE